MVAELLERDHKNSGFTSLSRVKMAPRVLQQIKTSRKLRGKSPKSAYPLAVAHRVISTF